MAEQSARWRYVSDHASLVVYHDGVKIAQFEQGLFETSDAGVAEVLRGHELCCEVAAPARATRATKKDEAAA